MLSNSNEVAKYIFKNTFLTTFLLGITINLCFAQEDRKPVNTSKCETQLTENCSGHLIEINDITMYVEIHGEGDPLFLLHGGTGFIETIAPQLIALSRKYKVIAPDIRGHGRSTGAESNFSYDLLMSDKLALMDFLDIKQAHFVGWSDGGIISLNMAINHPERVKSLALIGTNYSTSGIYAELKEYVSSLSANEWDPRVIAAYQANSPNPELWDVFFGNITSMWLSEPEFSKAELNNISAPTLVLAGAEENFIKESHTKSMAEHIKNSKLILIPEGTHNVPIEKPEEVNEVILGFLKEL